MTKVAIKKANPIASIREKSEGGSPIACQRCGGSIRSGCNLHDGMDIFACPKFEPLS